GFWLLAPATPVGQFTPSSPPKFGHSPPAFLNKRKFTPDDVRKFFREKSAPAAERIFSRIRTHFNNKQDSTLADYSLPSSEQTAAASERTCSSGREKTLTKKIIAACFCNFVCVELNVFPSLCGTHRDGKTF